MANLVNGNGIAYEQLNSVDDIVSDKLEKILGWAEAAKLAATQTIDTVGTIDLDSLNVDVVFPTFPSYNTTIAAPSAGDSNVPTSTVSNDPVSVAFTATDQVSFVAPDAVPDPVYGVPAAVPDRPSDSVELPPVEYPTVLVEDSPTAPTLTQPDAPTIAATAPPSLLQINVPDAPQIVVQPFAGDEVSDYDAEEEQLQQLLGEVEQLLSASTKKLDDTDEAYRTSEALLMRGRYVGNAPEDQVRALENGDLTTNLGNQRKRLMDEAASAIDRATLKETKALMTGWAGRNFSSAPGMLVDQVNEVEIEAGRKLREASSQINNEIAALAKDDMAKLLNLYVQLEQALIELHLEKIRRAVETEKLRVRSHIELFNSTLSLYSSKQEAIGVSIDAYNAELSAVLQVADGSNTAVKGAIAEAAENQARISIYGSQTDLLKAQTDVYKTQVKASTLPLEAFKAELIGVKANADTVVANIDSYRQAIQAYAASVDAASSEISAYAAQVQAAGSAAGVAETNARAYAMHIQEAVRRNDTYKTFASAQADVLSANLATFRDASQVNEGFLRAQAARVSAQADIEQSRITGYGQYIQHVASYNAALEARNNAALVYSLASAENAARAEALANQAQSEADKINAGALAGKSSAVASLAQGAMTAVHVRASAEGGSSTTNSYDYQLSTTSNWGGNKSLNETNVQRLSA